MNSSKIKNIQRDKVIAIVIQFMKFGIVGISNTLVSLVVYWVCFYSLYMHYLVANVIAFIVSVINAYCWNNTTT